MPLQMSLLKKKFLLENKKASKYPNLNLRAIRINLISLVHYRSKTRKKFAFWEIIILGWVLWWVLGLC